jgi:hypothetical protein
MSLWRKLLRLLYSEMTRMGNNRGKSFDTTSRACYHTSYVI